MMILSMSLLFSSIALFALQDDPYAYALVSQNCDHSSKLTHTVPLHILVKAQEAIPHRVTYLLNQNDTTLTQASEEELQALAMVLQAKRNEEHTKAMQHVKKNSCCVKFEHGVEACVPVLGTAGTGAFLSRIVGYPLVGSLICGIMTGITAATCLAVVTWPNESKRSSFDANIARIDGICKRQKEMQDGMQE